MVNNSHVCSWDTGCVLLIAVSSRLPSLLSQVQTEMPPLSNWQIIKWSIDSLVILGWCRWAFNENVSSVILHTHLSLHTRCLLSNRFTAYDLFHLFGFPLSGEKQSTDRGYTSGIIKCLRSRASLTWVFNCVVNSVECIAFLPGI